MNFSAKIRKWVLKTQSEEQIKLPVLTRFIIRFLAVWSLRGQMQRIRLPKTSRTTRLIALLSQYDFAAEEKFSGKSEGELDPEILGTVFEVLLDADSLRKKTGSFYTSPEIVRHMVESALCRYFCTETGEKEENVKCWIRTRHFPHEKSAVFLNLLKNVRILDPACGSGAFIMMMLEILLQFWNILEPGSAETAIQRKEFLLQHNIFGCDIQPMAVYITKLRCRLALNGKSFTLSNIITADTLCRKWTQKFDIVLGNPPYVPIGQISPEYRKVLQNKYRFATARFNLFYLFIEKSFDLLKMNGTAELIVPDRLLKNTQCTQLREWLLCETDLQEVITFPRGIFKSAIIDPVIIVFQKRASRKQTISCHNWDGNSSAEIPRTFFQNVPHFQLDLSCGQNQFDLLRKIRSKSVELGEIAAIRDGIIQGAVADQLFLNSPKDKYSKPLLIGEDIKPYHISFSDRWINYHPEKMLKLERTRRQNPGLRLRNISIFERNKILTRQTADKIIAVYDTEHYYYCNTLHGTTVTSEEYDPLFVTGVLNSTLMTWLYRTETSEAGKTFAQVKIAILKKLPVPRCSKKEQKQISEYAELLQKHPADVTVLRKRIDQFLYRIYQLSENEIAIIENTDHLSV